MISLATMWGENLALCYGFLPAERAIELLHMACARHSERKAYYEQLVRAAEADMQADDAHKAAVALGRRLTGRRGVGTQESYVAWCDEAIAAIEAFAADARTPTSTQV